VTDVPVYEHADVVLCPGGPMLLRGKHVIQDSDGELHETTRRVTALCRCDKSARKPWCDGTHKLLPEKLAPS
jgi:CDGSH-type Zn-finger protein